MSKPSQSVEVIIKQKNMLFEKKKFHMSIKDNWFIEHKKVRKLVAWISQNGKEKLIKNLDSNHLNNIIAKIERGEHESREDYIDVLIHEVNFRYLIDEITNQNN